MNLFLYFKLNAFFYLFLLAFCYHSFFSFVYKVICSTSKNIREIKDAHDLYSVKTGCFLSYSVQHVSDILFMRLVLHWNY